MTLKVVRVLFCTIDTVDNTVDDTVDIAFCKGLLLQIDD